MNKFIMWALMPFVLFFSIHMEMQAEENVVLLWNETTLSIIRVNNIPPTIAARTLAIVHTSMYDAWAAYDDQAAGTQRGITLRRPVSERTLKNKEEAISFAAFRTLVALFPDYENGLTNLMVSLGYNTCYTEEEPLTAAGIGNLASHDVLIFREDDGSNQCGKEKGSSGIPYSDYTNHELINSSTQLKDPNLWQPLKIENDDQKFLTPHWDFVVPFALETPHQFFPEILPATFPSKRYQEQAEEILMLSAGLNDRKKAIVEYWDDCDGSVTPSGHWNEFARFISERDQHTVDNDVKMFFILNNALLDSSIAAWHIKKFYGSVNPISAIRFLFGTKNVETWGGPENGTQIIMGKNWKPYISNPPSAEFVSEHSTFSSAAAEVLKLFTGSDKFGFSAVILKGSSNVEPGVVPASDITLSWKTFTEAANQAGFSRRLGGIHFKNGDVEGRKLGRQIGGLAFEIAQRYFEGLSAIQE